MARKTMKIWVKTIGDGSASSTQGSRPAGDAFVLFGGNYLISINSGTWYARVGSSYKDATTSISSPRVDKDKWTHSAPANDEAFAGFVDDFKIYSRALSSGEIKAEFAAGRDLHQE